jgi:hypothetical protein
VTIVRMDTTTIIRTDTLRRFDTCFIYRDTSWQALDTVCNGTDRHMIPQTYTYTLQVEPNPANDLTAIRYTLGDRGIWVLRLYDMSGTEVWKRSGNDLEGVYSATVDVSGLPRGMYLVQLIGRGGRVEALMSVKR